MNNGQREHIWHPYTRFSTLAEGPLPSINRGKGIRLFDKNGTGYIDAISSWWCNTLGHGHPRLIGAIKEQAAVLQHSILGNLSNPWADELARRLCHKMPSSDRHVMFASDGSCAVDAALKMALQYHYNRGKRGKTRFLTLEEDYHGDTMGAISVGYVPEFHKPFEFLQGASITVPLPDYKDGEGAGPTESVLDDHAHEIAAVILEPLCQGAAGMRMYDPQYLRDVERLCRQHDVLLIIDEIAMGFGRTGQYWAFEHADIDPDIVCVGKGLTGGYLPLSAAVCKDYIYETFTDEGGEDQTFYHGHTFGGNPIAAACALETMKIYEELDIAGRASRLGDLMASELKSLEGSTGVREVRSLGLIGVVELEPAPDTPARAAAIRDMLREEGVLLRPLGNVFYLMPPLIISEKELSDLCRTFIRTIRKFI